jgi:hypothetical protein
MANVIKQRVLNASDGMPLVFTEDFNPATGETKYYDKDGYIYKMDSNGLMPQGGARLPIDDSGRPILPTATGATAAAASGGPYTTITGASHGAEAAAAQGADFAHRIATGQSVDTDTGRLTPRQLLDQAASQGSPIGLTMRDSLSNNRAKQLQLAAAAPSHARAVGGAQQLASGQAAQSALEPAQNAYTTAAQSGAADFRRAGTGAQGVLGTAAGMGQDIGALRDAAAGRVASAAEIQQKRGIADAVSAQQSAAATARGGNAAAALRQAAGAGQGIMSRGIGDAAALRAQEQASARQQLTSAQQVQGALYGTGAQVAAQTGSAQAQRDLGVANGRTALGTADLAMRAQGVGMQGQQAQTELDSAKARVAQEQSDRELYLNAYLQWLSSLQGNAPAAIQSTTQRAIANQQAQQQETAAWVNGVATLGAGILGAL